MAQNRRNFLTQLAGISTGLIGMPWINYQLMEQIEATGSQLLKASDQEIARNEDFWLLIQRAYRQSPNFINLENGYFSPQPEEVMHAQFRNIQRINEIPSFYMRRHQHDEKLLVKDQLAAFAGCSPEEMVITRNTTEALDTVIAGIDLEKGEEAIMCDQEYGSMMEAFAQQARRRGIVNKIIQIPLHPKSDEEIVSCYEKEITSNTKLILVSQLINITGQVLPIRKISDMAHTHGVEVICDGAHAFAHLDFKIPDLNCDYYGASLHKWLCCPLGAGILYIKKEKISKVWPLFGDDTYPADDIRKLEHIGTHPVSTNLTISHALKFHQLIGSGRKQARLRYLKFYWVNKVKDLPRVIINTPFDEERSSAISNIAIEGMSPNQLAETLYDKYKIFTVAIDRESVKGIRVTPHVYTTIEELDKFVDAIATISKG